MAENNTSYNRKSKDFRMKGLREIKNITKQILAVYDVDILSNDCCLVFTNRKTGKISPLMTGPLGPLFQINAFIEDCGLSLLLECESLIGVVQNLFDYAWQKVTENENEVASGGKDE